MAEESEYRDVVIIGNGPSAITLSYLLSGHWPYYKQNVQHPNEYIHMRLTDEEHRGKSLIEGDLEYLSQGIQGRSINPVSVLFDQLQHPDADFGLEIPSTLEWKHQEDKYIDHLALGRGCPGGAWHQMSDCDTTLTISLGSWMQLPGRPIKQWQSEQQDTKRSESRVSLSTVANYYRDYVKQQGLRSNFRDRCIVKHVEYDEETELWTVKGEEMVDIRQRETRNYSYKAKSVVLASGNSDTPNTLNVSGENLPFVLHSLNELEHLLSNNRFNSSVSSSYTTSNRLTERFRRRSSWQHNDPIVEDDHYDMDPILVVGAGLSAADAIIALKFKRIPIIHVFRRHPDDPALVFNQLPENMYPEYHKVHSMMKQSFSSKASNNGSIMNEYYRPFPMHSVKEIRPNRQVVLENLISAHDTEYRTSITVKVSHVVVLIGKRPNLDFIQPPAVRANLGHRANMPINPRSNPIAIDPYTHETLAAKGLYAMGPLVGDNFVRFVQGGALAVANHLWKTRSVSHKMENEEICEETIYDNQSFESSNSESDKNSMIQEECELNAD